MSLLDGLAPGLVVSWLDKALVAAPAQVAKLPETLRAPALAGLVALTENKDAITALAPDSATFVRVVSRIALGQGDAVAASYLEPSTSFAERMAALDSASAATRAEKSDRAATWAAVAAVSENILVTLGKAALPFLLAIL